MVDGLEEPLARIEDAIEFADSLDMMLWNDRGLSSDPGYMETDEKVVAARAAVGEVRAEVAALRAALETCLEALDVHPRWCGFNPDAPGDGIFNRAVRLSQDVLKHRSMSLAPISQPYPRHK